MSIRWRLTLWFSLLLFAILVLSGGVLYALLQRYLSDGVDTNLETYTARVHGIFFLDQNPQPLDYNMIHSRLPTINEFASPGIYLQIVDNSGNVVVKSDNLGDQKLPVSPSLIERGFGGAAAIETVAAGDNARVRIMASPLHLKDRTLLLEVAQSLKPFDDTLSHVRWSLLAGVLVALSLAVISGASLVRRTLAPVGKITRTAQTIEEGSDLNRRVGYNGPPDEIGQLATTFDRMIERLNCAFESQKEFVADASHELRTPLTVVRGNLDLLKRDLNEADRRECFRAIDVESKRMSQIVNDLLLLAEIEAGEPLRQEEVALKGLVHEEFQRARQLAEKHKLSTGRLENISILGDAYKLKQLVGNLVGNAIKYTPEGGGITLSLFRDGDWARIEVADTGIGIAPEHLPRIFDRFYRVDKARSRAAGGTGLGLAIAKSIAEQHGGHMTVTSEPGKGSVFTAWLKV